MFAIGHFALGYLFGKGSSKALKTKLNMPLLLVVSVIPDIDLILERFSSDFMHRGPTHSIVTFTVIAIPFFIVYRKRAIPYYAALLSHSLIGDFFTGGIELLWPVNLGWYGIESISVQSLQNVTTEIMLFAVALVIMFRTQDLHALLKPNKYNLTLIVAFGAVLGPMISVGKSYESYLPWPLWIPSVFCLLLFGYSILVELRRKRG
jgi:membrane-bound metal-dependent hydrolase YbcI (DUF457 family)